MTYWLQYITSSPVTILLFVTTIIYFYLQRGWRRTIPRAGGVMITGASSGIGEATAIYLDSKGFTVFAGVRSSADYDRIKKLLSPRSIPVIIDVTKPSTIAEAVSAISNHLKKERIGLVGLINNAGICVLGPLECLPESELRYNFEVNLFGLINTTNAFLPLLRATSKFPDTPAFPQDIATIIHIGSAMGKVSMPFYGPYAMTKFALEAMADAQRLELSQTSNVRVCLIGLGNVNTPIFEKNNVRMRDNMGAMMEEYKSYLNGLPKVAEFVTQGAIMPISVAQSIESILTSSNPKARVLVGWEPYIMPIIWALLPTKLRDVVLVKLFSIITKMKR